MASPRKRARRSRNISLNEVLERVMEEGSDEELDLFNEEESDDSSDDESFVVPVGNDDSEGDTSSDSETESDDNTRSTPGNVGLFDASTDIDSDSSDSEDDADWVRNYRNFPSLPPFTGEPGMKFAMAEGAAPVDFYNLIVTSDVIKLMKRETNRYARSAIAAKERNGEELSRRSVFKTWKPVTEDEIRKFLAILIHIGLVKKPLLSDYWATDITVASPFAKKLMTRDRFKAILAFFHLNDNTSFIPRGQDGHDPLHKIRPFFDHLNKVIIISKFSDTNSRHKTKSLIQRKGLLFFANSTT